jgi:hypothetical protein
VPSKNASQADNDFAYYFRESLSVVTNAYLTAGREKDKRVLLYEPPVKLERKRGDALYMAVTQTYSISEVGKEFKAKTTSYSYELLVKKDGMLETIAEFHWHPDTTNNLKWPHVHVKGNSAEGELDRKHFPTARLAIEDFLRFLIRDFDVKTRLPYAQCKEILTKNKRAFIDGASWLYWKQLI